VELALEVALEEPRRGAMAEHSEVVWADLQMALEVQHELALDLVLGLVLTPGWPVA